MNNKASIMGDTILWIIIPIFVLLIAAIFIFLIPILFSAFSDTDSTMDVPGLNLTQANEDYIQPANNALGFLNWLPFALFMALAIGLLITIYFIRENTIILIVFGLFYITLLILSPLFSNFYESLIINRTALSNILSNMIGMNYIMLYLPYFVAVFGLIIILIIFIGRGGSSEQ